MSPYAKPLDGKKEMVNECQTDKKGDGAKAVLAGGYTKGEKEFHCFYVRASIFVLKFFKL